jgi:hypothetical protein
LGPQIANPQTATFSEGRKLNKNVLILKIADLWICDLQNLFADRPSLALKGV